MNHGGVIYFFSPLDVLGYYRAFFLCAAPPSLPATGLTIRAEAALGLSCLSAATWQDHHPGSINPFH
jgi:hypothetical protein